MGGDIFQTNAQERSWQGFLLAPDMEEGLPLPHSMTKASTNAFRDTVAEAWKSNRTIITSKGQEFVRAIVDFQYPPKRWECRDLWGLVVVPEEQGERVEATGGAREGLTVLSREHLHWCAAGLLNLYVRLERGSVPEIRHFRRCPYCERSVVIGEPWDRWYRGLGEVAPQ